MRYTTLSAATVAAVAAAATAAAVAVCYPGFLKVGLPEAANNHFEIKWVSR